MDELEQVDPRLWQSFLVLAEELHFSRAAARLYIAQPALSQRIRRLEAQVGVPLFERSSRRVALTPAARPLHRRVARSPQLLDETPERARALDGRRPLAVGMEAACRDVVTPTLSRAFAAT